MESQTRRRRRKLPRYSPVITMVIAGVLMAAMTISLFSRMISAGGSMQVQPDTPDTSTQSTPSTGESSEPTDPTPSETEPPVYLTPQEHLEAFAKENGLIIEEDYPEEVLKLLETHPEAIDFVLNYPLRKGSILPTDLSPLKNSKTIPLLMQWDLRWGFKIYGSDAAGLTGCGPTCLSMVAIYLTKNTDLTPAYLMDFAISNGYYSAGSGTAWTLFSQGAPKLGLTVETVPLVKNLIVRHVESGKPVILSMGPGAFTTGGHYIVLTGYTDGKFSVNDPNSITNSQKLWSYEEIKDQIKNIWAFSAS